jgi:beta-galactosidase
MLEKRCPAAIQQKLVDYVQQGGKLILAGRVCVEDFDHKPCTILADALGIQTIETVSSVLYPQIYIDIFDYEKIPVSLVESYTGEFDEVFARRDNNIVGFVKGVGAGRVMMLGASMLVTALEDLAIVEQMALRLEIPRLFEMEDWLDGRVSVGENGRFLYLNNYQDDSVSTTISYQNENLFDGHAVQLAARTGLILPLEWQMTPDIMIHYVTSEIVDVLPNGSTLTLKTAQKEFTAELTLAGYQVDKASLQQPSGSSQRVKLTSTTGEIILKKK